jgi:hypothetical protein
MRVQHLASRCLQIGLLLLGSCAASYRIVPEGGGSVAEVSRRGIRLIADAAAWRADPSDLPSHLIPVWVSIINRGQEEVAVHLYDFSLADERGLRSVPTRKPGSVAALPDAARHLGLPETIVAGGGRAISGFIYFAHASRATRLSLTWRARSPRGQAIAELTARFEIVLY